MSMFHFKQKIIPVRMGLRTLVGITLGIVCSLLPWEAKADPAPLIPGDAEHAPLCETTEQRDARMRWWRDAKFGMFIHFGLYSGLEGQYKGRDGGAEWLQKNLEISSEDYAREALPRFRPVPGCTEQWAELAQTAGCRYAVLTSKHHEGFALFTTKQSDYSAPSAIGRDIVGEFAQSMRARNIRVGFYHSVIDWHHPAYDNTICPDLAYPAGQAEDLLRKGIPRDHAAYKRYLHAQVHELLSQYGKVDIIWWDYSQGKLSGETGWGAIELMQMARELHPGIIMNNRLYAYSGYDAANDKDALDLRCGDFRTPEKRLLTAGAEGDWETCMTLAHLWGFNAKDTRYKTPAELIRQLQYCAAYGGNLLLNISPRADGSVAPAAVDIFRRIGRWMQVNGETIYGSRPIGKNALPLPHDWLACRVGNAVYLFPPLHACTEEVRITLPAEGYDFHSARVLGQPDCPVRITRTGEQQELVIPAGAAQLAPEGLPVIRLD